MHASPIPGSGLLRWAEVHVDALRHNVATVRAMLQPGARLMAMVKSDGYGHGAGLAAEAAVAAGASWLGVYTPDEALALRSRGFGEPILVAGWSPPAIHSALLSAEVDVAVLDADGLRALAAAARAAGTRARVHVKLDTGLGRLGVRPEGMEAFTAALRQAAADVEVRGIFTHFADAEGDPDFTRRQHERFLDGAAQLRPLAREALLHTAGTAAIVRHPEMHHDMVRLGIGLYGYGAAPFDVRPAMTVCARIAQVKMVRAGDSVGYGRTWTAGGLRRIATVAIGYGQGVPRALGNVGSMMVRGHRCAMVGTVSMDQVTLDVSDVSDVDDVAEGEEAIYFGSRDGSVLPADEVAALVGTISYELLCRVSCSVPRLVVDAAAPGE